MREFQVVLFRKVDKQVQKPVWYLDIIINHEQPVIPAEILVQQRRVYIFEFSNRSHPCGRDTNVVTGAFQYPFYHPREIILSTWDFNSREQDRLRWRAARRLTRASVGERDPSCHRHIKHRQELPTLSPPGVANRALSSKKKSLSIDLSTPDNSVEGWDFPNRPKPALIFDGFLRLATEKILQIEPY